MNIKFLEKPLGCLLVIIILFVIAGSILSSAINLVEVSIIKWLDPSHKTRYEVAEEKAKEKQKITEEEAIIRKEKQKIELEIEIKEDLVGQKMLEFVNPRKVETILRNKGYAFEIGHFVYCVSYVYVLNNNIWVGGDLVREDANKQKYYFPTLVFSDNGGEDYRVLKIFEELVSRSSSHSALLFLDKKNGYLAIYSTGPSSVYKTSDGGLSWDKILTINSVPIRNASSCVNRIRITNQNIYLIISFEGGENHKYTGWDHDSIESVDDGKTWVYKRNYKEAAKTSDNGTTWEVIKNNQ